MNKYINIPIVIEATQIVESDFSGDHPNDNHVPGVTYMPQEKQAIINTPEGQMIGVVGDWIAKDAKGNLRRHKPEQFRRLFTPVNNAPLDQALTTIAAMTQLLEALPNPLPASRWEQRYIEWWYNWTKQRRIDG